MNKETTLNYDLPNFNSANQNPLIYPFDIEKYIEEYSNSIRTEYYNHFTEFVDQFKQSLTADRSCCKIFIGKDKGISIPKKKFSLEECENLLLSASGQMRNNAIKNFLHLLKSKGYSYEYQLKYTRYINPDNYYDDEDDAYIVWNEIIIHLK